MVKERGDADIWRKKYTVHSGFADYVDYVGKAAVPKAIFVKCMRRFFWKLSRVIILHQYEWKLPEKLGYIRIAKKKATGQTYDKNHYRLTGEKKYVDFYLTNGWKFYWYWDRRNRNARIHRRNLWEFDPVTDWTGKKIGDRGLQLHVIKSALDPYTEDYDVINRSHL